MSLIKSPTPPSSFNCGLKAAVGCSSMACISSAAERAIALAASAGSHRPKTSGIVFFSCLLCSVFFFFFILEPGSVSALSGAPNARGWPPQVEKSTVRKVPLFCSALNDLL